MKYNPVLIISFSITNIDNPILKVNILFPQQSGLRRSKATAIEKPKEDRDLNLPKFYLYWSTIFDLITRLEEVFQFLFAKGVRYMGVRPGVRNLRYF